MTDNIISGLIMLVGLIAVGLYLQYQIRLERVTKMKNDDLKAIEETMKELKILKNRRNPRSQGKTYNLLLHVDFGEALLMMPGIGIDQEADKSMSYEELFAKLGKKLDQAIIDPVTFKNEQLAELNTSNSEF